MNNSFKGSVRKMLVWSVGVFVVLFALRMAYGYMSPETRRTYVTDATSNTWSGESVKKNYASENIFLNKAATPASSVLNQKYEKTATIKTKTSEFEQDEQRVRAKSKAFSAVIQYEENTGQKGSRQIQLSIGVNPALFDSFCAVIQKIGSVKAINITKTDKTTEFKQLNAKKLSIEKTLASLNDLKAKTGEIADFVALHDKILEIEDKLQELGVNLGDFDSENEFCTVKLTLYEGSPEGKIRLAQRVKVAFEWALKYYAIGVFSVLCLTALFFLLLVVIDKLKVISAIVNKMKG